MGWGFGGWGCRTTDNPPPCVRLAIWGHLSLLVVNMGWGLLRVTQNLRAGVRTRAGVSGRSRVIEKTLAGGRSQASQRCKGPNAPNSHLSPEGRWQDGTCLHAENKSFCHPVLPGFWVGLAPLCSGLQDAGAPATQSVTASGQVQIFPEPRFPHL